jgi:hypothetical protein
MNEKNLIPNSERTPKELREMTSKGGRKSGEVRRRKKMMKEIAQFQVYEMELSEPLRQSLSEQGIDVEQLNHANVMVRGMIARAEQGDVSAFNALLVLLGEKPKEQIGADIDLRMKIEYVHSERGISFSEDEIDEG